MRKKLFLTGIISLGLILALSACKTDDDSSGGGDAVVTLTAISGVTAPVTGGTPVTSVDSAQYSGTVTWAPVPAGVGGTFVADTVYTATITLTAKAGYTLKGVVANSFTVAGANPVTNPVDSGVVTAVFPATVTAAPVVPVVTLEHDNIKIHVSWTVVAEAVSYQVVWGMGRETPPDTLTASNSADINQKTTYMIGGLVNNNSYSVWVRGKKGDGTYTTYSEKKTATPQASEAEPTQPVITVTPTDDGQIKISWSVARWATSYDILLDIDPNILDAEKVDTVTVTEFTTTAASFGTFPAGTGPSYYVWVIANNTTNPANPTSKTSDLKQVTVIRPPADQAEFEGTNWKADAAIGATFDFQDNNYVVYKASSTVAAQSGTYNYNVPDLLTLTIPAGSPPVNCTVIGKTFMYQGTKFTKQ
jgi:hypothetical protein